MMDKFISMQENKLSDYDINSDTDETKHPHLNERRVETS